MKADPALPDALQRMERDALVKVFDEYAPALYDYVVRTCRDSLTADRIVRDVFARLLVQLSSGLGPCENVRSSLYASAYDRLAEHTHHSAALTELQRQVIILRFLEGFSPRETAEILGKSVSHVKVEQSCALAVLGSSLMQW